MSLFDKVKYCQNGSLNFTVYDCVKNMPVNLTIVHIVPYCAFWFLFPPQQGIEDGDVTSGRKRNFNEP